MVADVPSQIKSSALGERVRESWGSFSVDIKDRIWMICVSMSLCRSPENPDICQIMLTPVEEPCLPITERVEISVSRNHTCPVWKVTECRCGHWSRDCHMTCLICTMDDHPWPLLHFTLPLSAVAPVWIYFYIFVLNYWTSVVYIYNHVYAILNSGSFLYK